MGASLRSMFIGCGEGSIRLRRSKTDSGKYGVRTSVVSGNVFGSKSFIYRNMRCMGGIVLPLTKICLLLHQKKL